MSYNLPLLPWLSTASYLSSYWRLSAPILISIFINLPVSSTPLRSVARATPLPLDAFGVCLLRCPTYLSSMYSTVVDAQACHCFTVMFTDLRSWERVVFPHFLPFEEASVKALEYQSMMDPERKSFDFRVHMCS